MLMPSDFITVCNAPLILFHAEGVEEAFDNGSHDLSTVTDPNQPTVGVYRHGNRMAFALTRERCGRGKLRSGESTSNQRNLSSKSAGDCTDVFVAGGNVGNRIAQLKLVPSIMNHVWACYGYVCIAYPCLFSSVGGFWHMQI